MGSDEKQALPYKVESGAYLMAQTLELMQSVSSLAGRELEYRYSWRYA